ncbi:hypothetical protein PC113_g13341 [Phytophthora cactorum]|uniref:Uncharacterized protein n=1 Tax=Phytophthora cactorum TaxID=29920 RepID=A0A8T0YXM0_9STRA|nr:hypothetical protein PC112_g12772 [Phytophthora cactorum]KAG2854400.1 hypothetical protein PC113_g13341 [Phytophthora cactorum]
MAEAPGQKRKHDKAPGARKRRRVRSSLEGAPTETASALGGVEVFKDVWGWLVKAGWTSKRPFSKSLDSRYKYVRPGGRHNDNEGGDYLLGELAVLRYVENMRVSEVAAEQANQSTSEGEVAGVRRAVGQAVVTEHREHGTSEQEARSTSRAAGAVADGSEALGNIAADVVAVVGERERSKRGDRAELNDQQAAASTFGTDERGAGKVGEVSAGGSGHGDQEVVVERGAQGHDPRERGARGCGARGRGARGGRTGRSAARTADTTGATNI